MTVTTIFWAYSIKEPLDIVFFIDFLSKKCYDFDGNSSYGRRAFEGFRQFTDVEV